MRTQPLLALLALAVVAPAQGPAVGDKVADVMLPALRNGDGRQRLAEFYGRPVVLDQWGIH